MTTLNGTTDVTDDALNTISWNAGLIEGLVLTDGVINMSSGPWQIHALFIRGDTSTGSTTMEDNDSAAPRLIGTLGVSTASFSMSLTTTQIDNMTSNASTNTITTGSAEVNSMNLHNGAATNTVTIGTGGVRSFSAEGDTSLTLNGQTSLVDLGAGDDQVSVTPGISVSFIEAGAGNDTVSVHEGGVGGLDFGGGNDRANLSGNSVVFLMGSENTGALDLNMSDNARVHSMRLGGTNFDFDLTGNARIENIRDGGFGTHDLRLEDSARIDLYRGYGSDGTFTAIEQSRFGAIFFGEGDGTFTFEDDARINVLDLYDGTFTVSLEDGRLGTLRAGMADVTLTLGNGGAGTLETGDGVDNITTGAGYVDYIATMGGNDSVTLGSGGAGVVRLGLQNDVLDGRASDIGLEANGGKGHDTMRGSDYEDYLVGFTGNDWIYGEDGDDLILGGGGKDKLFGGTGNDTILGGTGNDRLKGNGGNDVFIFEAGAGTDKIENFQDGADLLVINDHVGGFGTLSFTDTGTHLHIDHDGGRITLLQMSGTVLTEADFVFG
ncbi:MAG: hypothetical protein N4A53_02975 [Pelagimonas sp.]|jgi:Ca2+-binding RTX toxin-like protein|nr:hypothetical protein [Pelagimonas sp.]